MKHSILCIDDEDINLKAFERMLKSKYNVLTASSTAAAYETLNGNNNIACVLSDYRMPEESGIEFFKKIKTSQPHTKRILLTGQADTESALSAINEGEVFRYLTKPFDFKDLINTVDQAVQIYSLERSLELKNQELQKAVDELKTLDVAKNQFMILVNHELKTPLTALVSFLSLLQETKLTEEQTLYTNRISQNADRLQNMMNEILDLVSAQTQSSPLQVSKTSTHNLIQHALSNFTDSAKLKDLDFVIEGENHSVTADSQALLKVLNHLIENAVKFADDKTSIKLKTQKSESGKVTFQGENKGATLSDKVIESMKKPFYLNEDIMNHSKGLGLGLSLSEALLKRHNSHLNISSHDETVLVEFELPSLSEEIK